MSSWMDGTQVRPIGVDRFEECLAHTLWHETGYRQPVGGPFVRGKFTNDPDDSGGPTMMGVTQVVYDGWRDSNRWPRQSVRYITDDEARAIYRVHYWDLVRGDELPRGVDVVMYDYGVNSGCGKATKSLQEILRVRVDGAMGAVTLAAAARQDPVELVRALIEERRSYVRGRKNYWKFGKGWETRIDRLEREALSALGYSGNALAEYGAADDVDDEVYCGGRARHDPPAGMLRSKTAWAAGGMGTGAVAAIIHEIASAISNLASSEGGVTLFALVLTLAASSLFMEACSTLIGSIYVWIERRKKLRHEGV